MKKNRIGETVTNNFGSTMVIVEYRNALDIDIYFPEYNWTAKGMQYSAFKKGKIKCPYDKSIYGVGYLGEGSYKTIENSKQTRVYSTWHNMLTRCYSEKEHERHPTYIGCETSEEFLNFQNFGFWDSENYYEIEGEQMHLDKDILCKGNKIYSPDVCIYVPQTINVLFTKRQNDRGDNPIGVSYHKRDEVYEVYCCLINPKTGKSKSKYLGYYETQEKGFEVYKYYKEKNIKVVADYFKEQIPQRLYDALYEYEVEIDD